MTQKKKTTEALLDQDKPFLFTHEGKSYTLPRADAAMKAVSGGEFMDMMLSEDEQGQIKFVLRLLINSRPDEDALAALRSMGMSEFSEVLGKWISSSGVSLGE